MPETAILVSLASLGVVLLSGGVAVGRLQRTVSAGFETNERDHRVMNSKLDKQNGSLSEHGQDIAALKVKCE